MRSTARKSPPRCEYLCVPPFDRGEGHCNDNDEVGTGRRIVDDEDNNEDDDEDAMLIIQRERESDRAFAATVPNRTSRDTCGLRLKEQRRRSCKCMDVKTSRKN